jgi:BASS family bile acid:Na+ symporter
MQATNMQDLFKIMVVIFTVGNLAAMGLELNVREAIRALGNTRFVALAFVWGWVVGPAFAYLLTKVLPLAEPYAIGLLLAGPAPCAPFYPLVVKKARGDVAFAAAFLLLAAVGTVLMMPLMVPLLIKGLTVSAWAIAKPLLTLVLTPLLIGIALRVCAAPVAARLFPVVKRIAGIATLILLVLVLVFYGKGMLNSMGGFAIGAQILFLGGMTLVSHKVGFGLKAGTEKRNGSGDWHTQHRSGVCGAHGHSEPGLASGGNGRTGGPAVGDRGVHCGAIVRRPGRRYLCGGGGTAMNETEVLVTSDVAALCKMADRGQITGAVLDGPLAMDSAISPEAARTQGIDSPRGRRCGYPQR